MRVLLVLPVYNEAKILRSTIEKIMPFISSYEDIKGIEIKVLVADNDSTDTTPEVMSALLEEFSKLAYLRVDNRGRGFALQAAWSRDGYDLYLYTDADLAYDLSLIPHMIRTFWDGNDVMVGSRLVSGSVVIRPLLRKFLTSGYNLLLKVLFRNKFTDAQAGCKAISLKVRDEILHLAQEGGWFFDTLLLLLAERRGYHAIDLPVVCIDPRKWRLSLIRTIGHLFYKSLKLRWQFWFHD